MDIQRTMEFILEQNAANAVQLQKLESSVSELSHTVALHERDLNAHTEWLTGLSQAMQELAGQMQRGFDTVATKHNELAAAQKTTEENLNILIRTVQDILPRNPPQHPTA